MRKDGSAPQTSVAELARDAMTRGLEALAAHSSSNPGGIQCLAAALKWLDRAHRLAPLDANTAVTLASACVANDPARAVALFHSVAQQHDVRQAWLGLVAGYLRLSGPKDAAPPLAVLLSRFAFMPDTAALARAVGGHLPCPGWCAMRSDGRLVIHLASATGRRTRKAVQVFLDGKLLPGTTLPGGWERGRSIDVRIDETPLLGSPI